MLKEKCQEECKLCEAKLTLSDLEQHICLDQDSITCSWCSHSPAFESTVEFLEHLGQHNLTTKRINTQTLYKCNQCYLAFSMKILLECHKKSHRTVVIKPESSNFSIEHDEPMAIDAKDYEYSIAPEFFVNVEMHDDSMSGPPEKNEPYDETAQALAQLSSLGHTSEKPSLKCKLSYSIFMLSMIILVKYSVYFK